MLQARYENKKIHFSLSFASLCGPYTSDYKWVSQQGSKVGNYRRYACDVLCSRAKKYFEVFEPS
jgi:hypothetical protein